MKSQIATNVYNLRESIGMPEYQLNTPAWEIHIPISMKVYVVNIYRKIAMKEIGQYRLSVESIEKDDPYVISDYIAKRISQIVISQDEDDSEYTLYCKNPLSQELLVSSEHIRWNGKSAIHERKLCDKVPILKLGIGKYIKISMKKKKVTPNISDIYRPTMISHTQKSGYENTFTHDAICEKIYMLQYGGVKNMKQFNQEVTGFLAEVVSRMQLSMDIQYDILQNFYQITFPGMPVYLLDTLLCYCHKTLISMFENVKQNKEPKTSPSLVLFLGDQSDKITQSQLKEIIMTSFDNIQKDLHELANHITKTCHSV